MRTYEHDESSLQTMVTALTEDKNSNGYKRKIYKEDSDNHKQEMLAADIRNKAILIRSDAEKVNLSVTEDVQRRVDLYLNGCAEAGTFPSMSGLCAFGFHVSRQWVSRWKQQHPQHPTTQYLDTISDALASIMVNAALYGNASAPMTIFELKNNAGYRDTFAVEPVKPEPVKEEYSVEEIKRRYGIISTEHDLEYEDE